MSIRGFVAILCLLGGAWGLALPAVAQPQGAVVEIPIHGTIDAGTARLVAKTIADARAQHARGVLLDIRAGAALPAAASAIRATLLDADLPVDAYVRRAPSSAALIVLSADHIAIAPDGTIGGTIPAPQVRDLLEAAAQQHHRDTRIAGAMVDPTIDVAAYKPPGALLTLNAADAQASGMADTIAASPDAALAAFGDANAPRERASYSPLERFAHLLTRPDVGGVLLALGFLGLLVELQTLHGIAGTLGVGALALFFASHLYDGFASPLAIALALAGVLLIAFELHVVPGHAIAGTSGVVALVAAVVLAFGPSFMVAALQALALAIVLSALGFVLLQRVLPENAFVRRLMFAGAQGADYVASADYRSLLGRSGVAISFLRPAGLATFDDRRVDVLSEGDFVPAGTPVRVTRVEGARIFVKPEGS